MQARALRSLGCWSLSLIAMGCVHPAAPGAGPAAPKGPTAPAAPPTPAVHDVADASSDAGTLQSKVTRVTVYSDRARVTRQAVAEAPATPAVFAFRGLPVGSTTARCRSR
jgi:hypothetical protein